MTTLPNILFLHSDEHSYRFLSCRSRERGGEPCRTPTLDGLARRGVFFDAAYCQMPLCTPSRIAMLTGRHSHRCGAWGNNSVLPPDLPTFGSHLREAGYATATIGKMHIGGSRQMAGFGARPYGDFGGPCAHQDDPLEPRTSEGMRARTLDAGVSQIPESLLQENVVAREAVAWLREHRHAHPGTPWLLYTSFSRPHFPLTAPRRHFERYYPEGVTPPPVGRTGDSAQHPMTVGAVRGFRTDEIGPEEGRKARAAYFACVDFLDEMLGDFLAVLDRDGFLDDAVIVYTSDHGELAGEHGLWWKNTWHEAATRVPLIISLPEHRRGDLQSAEVTTPVTLADIFPTLCGLAGRNAPADLDGIDLAPLLRAGPCPALDARSGVIIEALTPRWGAGTEFRAIRDARYKYIAFRDCEHLAFDLIEDPLEQRNLARSADPAVAARLGRLREALLGGFDFDAAEVLRKAQTADLRARFPARFQPKTPNQILLGDGRLAEADAPLCFPQVLSTDLAADLDDHPAGKAKARAPAEPRPQTHAGPA